MYGNRHVRRAEAMFRRLVADGVAPRRAFQAVCARFSRRFPVGSRVKLSAPWRDHPWHLSVWVPVAYAERQSAFHDAALDARDTR